MAIVIRCLARCATLLSISGVLAGTALAAQTPNGVLVPISNIADQPGNAAWVHEKALLQKEGEQFPNARALYDALKAQAHGGQPLDPAALPDWTGIYTRVGSIFRYDVDKSEDYGYPIAPLKPQWRAKNIARIEQFKRGIEYDEQLSSCLPVGVPRWFTEPYLREFVVTPKQTWLMNELANETRRVYTDGRDHPKPVDQYPLFDGDSIGFWSGGKLIVHTNQLSWGVYQRAEPDHSDKAELVEIWRKADPSTLLVDVWVYDPVVLTKPWYTRQTFSKDPNVDYALRINYYDCVGTPNTRVIKRPDGSSTFEDLDFDKSTNAPPR